jgi:hypothetical protein
MRFFHTVDNYGHASGRTYLLRSDVLQQGRHLAGPLAFHREVKASIATDAVERPFAHPHLHRPVLIRPQLSKALSYGRLDRFL